MLITKNYSYRGKIRRDEKRGNDASISHRNGFHDGSSVHGNVIQYHMTKKSHSKEYSCKFLFY